MQKQTFSLIILTVFLFSLFLINNQKQNQALQKPLANFDLDKELSDIQIQNNLQGFSIAIQNQNGETIYDKGFGYANYEQKKKTSSNTYYRIASISKSVSTTSLLILYEQGKFKLTDDISTILGYTVRNPRFPTQPITVQNVLSHTSSIRDGTTYDDFLSFSYNTSDPLKIPNLSEILTSNQGPFYSNTTFGTQPQGYFTYSNLNFGICGALVERLSGERFDIFARKHVLQKLNLTGSFNVADIEDWENIAVLYLGQNGTWVPYYDQYASKPIQRNLTSYVPGTNGLIYGAQGGLHVRMNELIIIMKMFAYEGTVNGVQILSKDSVRKMTSLYWLYNGHNGDTEDGLIRGYGLAIHITTNTINQDIVFPKITMKGHTGSSNGLASNMFFDPITKKGFVFAINGALNGYNSSNTSSFIYAEQKIQQAVYNFLYQ